ncbi:hypothetical protein MHYP_G00266430 [Metynnis hypsauchen]
MCGRTLHTVGKRSSHQVTAGRITLQSSSEGAEEGQVGKQKERFHRVPHEPPCRLLLEEIDLGLGCKSAASADQLRGETDHANLPPGPNQKEGLLHPSSSVSDWLALRPCRCGKRQRACLQCCVERDDFFDGYWEREFMGNLQKLLEVTGCSVPEHITSYVWMYDNSGLYCSSEEGDTGEATISATGGCLNSSRRGTYIQLGIAVLLYRGQSSR